MFPFNPSQQKAPQFPTQPINAPTKQQANQTTPTGIEGVLADVVKRLGRIEKHLIDIRDAVATDPGQPRYVIDRHLHS